MSRERVVDCAIALGANQDSAMRIMARFADVADRLRAAGHALVGVSDVYRSVAVGAVTDQADFINAAVRCVVRGPVAAQDFLATLLQWEFDHGRDRGSAEPGGPRPLDLDLLWFGAHRSNTSRLTLPHPRLHQRRFVLYPLADLYGFDGLLPTGQTIAAALALSMPGVEGVMRLGSWDDYTRNSP